MRTFFAALLAATLAAPLPLAFHSYAMAGEGTGGAKKPTWEQESWSYEAKSPAGFSDPRPHELNEQIAINNEHRRRTIEQLSAEGGCSAPVIPYGYAVECGGFLVNNAPFGGADNGQMGSSGD